ncbi:hypothetical protein J2W98_004855 [Paenibacillus peoriae]|jgi:hypothetical protein|uniref:Uncharacterized protein n=1 Tax=Paenibacillus peoriae TaxID=59893 RepID=A0ABU1QLY1_9BACL|nr:hypothetical protein [Paenibacillus peoriae]SFR24832.1 hypothetical protein SAMN04488603_10946 [Paenibacillus sp. cl130]
MYDNLLMPKLKKSGSYHQANKRFLNSKPLLTPLLLLYG